MDDRTVIGFLHTSPVHVATFDALVAGRATAVHVVDERLLADARARGTDDAGVTSGVQARLDQLADRGAAVTLCTCSTIGAGAERLGATRVDRPMFAAAARTGGPVTVVAAIESAVEPAVTLLAEEAAAAGTAPAVLVLRCFDAWAAFEAGDGSGYHAALAAAIDALPAEQRVVVLAQASMAGAAALVRTERTVLSSPALAVDALLAALER
jgi:hypothetical protein